MGKPIAGQNQPRFGLTGILVDGANIEGVTYAKSLYIYKQRSDVLYDLMDSAGNIFQFIEIGYQDVDGGHLDYFTPASQLVLTIPKNTFFIKIHDAARDIFSFVRLYHNNKCITFDGDYVFKPTYRDGYLSGVLINPTRSQLAVGEQRNYYVEFTPFDYDDKTWEWFIDPYIKPVRPAAVEIVSVEDGYVVVRGVYEGTATLTFVPNSNKLISSTSIIDVIAQENPVNGFMVFDVSDHYMINTTEVFPGLELKLKVVTDPFDVVLSKPLTIQTYFDDMLVLKHVSDDFRTYTFDVIDSPRIPDSGNIAASIRFDITSPIEHSVVYGNILVRKKMDMPNTRYNFPLLVSPGEVVKLEKYKMFPEVGELEYDYKYVPIQTPTLPSSHSYIDDQDNLHVSSSLSLDLTRFNYVGYHLQWTDSDNKLHSLSDPRSPSISNKVYKYFYFTGFGNTPLKYGDTKQIACIAVDPNGYSYNIPMLVFENAAFKMTENGTLSVLYIPGSEFPGWFLADMNGTLERANKFNTYSFTYNTKAYYPYSQLLSDSKWEIKTNSFTNGGVQIRLRDEQPGWLENDYNSKTITVEVLYQPTNLAYNIAYLEIDDESIATQYEKQIYEQYMMKNSYVKQITILAHKTGRTKARLYSPSHRDKAVEFEIVVY